MHKFPMASENTFVAVSNPKLTSICSFLRSPSIVLGHPIITHFELFLAKYSAKRHAFVFESSPPITARPSRLSLVAFSREDANYSGV